MGSVFVNGIEQERAGQTERSGRKLAFTRHGLDEDPRRLHVAFDYRDRVLIGEVIDVRRDFFGSITLICRHFDGSPWPVEPLACLVRVIG